MDWHHKRAPRLNNDLLGADDHPQSCQSVIQQQNISMAYSTPRPFVVYIHNCPSAAPQSNNVIMVIHPWPGRRWIFTIGGSSSSAHHYNRNRWGHVCLVPSRTFLLNFDAPMSCYGTDGWAANQVNGALMVFIFICPTFIRLYYEHVVRCGTKQLR